MQCPDCGSEIGKARYCGCGWKEPKKEVVSGAVPDPVLGYIRCEWRAGGEQCRYPGSLSSNTRGGGPWYCSGHFRCSDPLMGAAIVDASRSYSQPSRATLEARHQERAEKRCAELGLKTVEQKRAWVLEQVRKLSRKMDASMPREPGEDREEEAAA